MGARYPDDARARNPSRPAEVDTGRRRGKEEGDGWDRGREMTEASEGNALRSLRESVGSGRPLVYIRSPEEQRVAALLRDVAHSFFSSPVPLWTWSLTQGMRGEDGAAAGTEVLGPRAALDFVVAHDGPALFVLRDFHESLRDSAEVRRRVRDLYEACFDRGKFVFICSPVKIIPEEIERDISYLELALPDLAELAAFIRDQAATIKAAGGTADDSDATVAQLARALQG